MKKRIKVGAVSYLNTKPLIYGFQHGLMEDEIELAIDYPARIASMLLKNEIDIGLIPVAALPLLKKYYIISDYCIGCDGEVASVCLFSDVPLKEIKTVLLDYQSRTSVELLKILLKEHWKISPKLIATKEGYEEMISDDTAGLIIGDRALQKSSKYKYDLGLTWKQMTGLPFVFACWVSNRELPEDFIANFNKANQLGIDNIEKVIAENYMANVDLRKYYMSYIDFSFQGNMTETINIFLDKIYNNEGCNICRRPWYQNF